VTNGELTKARAWIKFQKLVSGRRRAQLTNVVGSAENFERSGLAVFQREKKAGGSMRSVGRTDNHVPVEADALPVGQGQSQGGNGKTSAAAKKKKTNPIN